MYWDNELWQEGSVYKISVHIACPAVPHYSMDDNYNVLYFYVIKFLLLLLLLDFLGWALEAGICHLINVYFAYIEISCSYLWPWERKILVLLWQMLVTKIANTKSKIFFKWETILSNSQSVNLLNCSLCDVTVLKKCISTFSILAKQPWFYFILYWKITTKIMNLVRQYFLSGRFFFR